MNRAKVSDYSDFESFARIDRETNQKSYWFYDKEFEITVSIHEAKYIYFKNCVFKDFELISTKIEQCLFQNCEFNGYANFNSTEIQSYARFHNVIFQGNVSFDHTKFQGICEFGDVTVEKRLIFFRTDFESLAFTRSIFKENVLFTYAIIKNTFTIRGIRFKKGLDLSNAIISKGINIFNFELWDFKSTFTQQTGVDYDNAVSVLGDIPAENKRETFRIIKKQLDSQGNMLDSLDFSYCELESFRKQLRFALRSGTWAQKRTWFRDLLILELNRLSNGHSTSWLRGAFFTLFVSLLLYYAAIISTKNYYIDFHFSRHLLSANAKYFFEFLTPTHKTDYLDVEGATGFTYLWDFVGRIFVAYGIYQTVQAFRKYKI